MKKKVKTQPADERDGLPSASSIERLALCPGSRRMCDSMSGDAFKLPEMERYAEAGDRIHLWLQDPEIFDLTDPDEREVGEMCATQRDHLLQKHFLSASAPDWTLRERRLWYRDRFGKRLFSGKMDFAAGYKSTGEALLVDYKTGRGDQTESPQNMQLRANAVLLAFGDDAGSRGITRLHVAIIQPLVSSKPEVCTYEWQDLYTARQQMDAVISQSNLPTAPLNAGVKQCTHCPAKLKCPVALATVEQFTPERAEWMRGLKGKEMADMLDKSKTAAEIIRSLNGYAKQLLQEEPEAIPGWRLKPGGKTRNITDPTLAMNSLMSAKLIDVPSFVKRCIRVDIGETERAVAEFSNLPLKDAKAEVRRSLLECVEEVERAPSLEKI